MKNPTLRAALGALLVVATAAACTSTSRGSDAAGRGRLTVSSTDDGCDVSADSAPSGTLVFDVRNDGSKVTEFYLYAADGKRIVGEVENIGPGISRQLVVKVSPGSYVTACKPGMGDAGIRGDFTVTGSGRDTALSADDQRLVDAASADYGRFVRTEADALLAGTKEFVAAMADGRDDEARRLYPRVRSHWERIEPVAESFGDLDPRMDAREADLAQGQEWSGWHRLEKDLWPPRGADAGPYTPLTAAQRTSYAGRLLADTETLHRRVQRMTFGEDQIANGAKELLDEVATGKVTGEEEVWSHTDLFDFQANVDGARRGFTGLRPLLERRDPELASTIAARFTRLQHLLDRYRAGDGFESYDALRTAQVKELSDGVNALSEPLSRLTAAVVAL
ncbi:MAG: iron uptake system protein EfeO [Nocardioidaceae bacterium]